MLASEVLIQCAIRNRGLESMDDSSYGRNFDQDKKNETIAITGKSILKWIVVKWEKYSSVKFANFVCTVFALRAKK